MLPIYGMPKYILKREATFLRDNESWFSILDSELGSLVRVPLTGDQARLTAQELNLTVLSAADYLRLSSEGS